MATAKKATAGESKLAQARVMYDQAMNDARLLVLAKFEKELGMSATGASTYYYRIKKEAEGK